MVATTIIYNTLKNRLRLSNIEVLLVKSSRGKILLITTVQYDLHEGQANDFHFLRSPVKTEDYSLILQYPSS